jgi:hypothetical protein
VAYAGAAGNELTSGKFASPESSAALVANVFGLFLDRPADMPMPCEGRDWGWPPTTVRLEAVVRFPWSGGRHPCLDVLVGTPSAIVGIESKRYEPYRPKTPVVLSDAYWRPVWGERMGRYTQVRDGLRDGTCHFQHLDAAQLIKHAFGLRTAVHKERTLRTIRPILLYLHAEPHSWPDGRAVALAEIEAHRREIGDFSGLVAGDEVIFHATTYTEVLRVWNNSSIETVRAHVAAVQKRFNL